MARYKDGLRVATTIFEAAAWGYAVRVICPCQHFGVFDPHGLWWHFQRKGWKDDLRLARKHFYCSACMSRDRQKMRPAGLDLVKERPTICLPLPSPQEWRRAVNRFRG